MGETSVTCQKTAPAAVLGLFLAVGVVLLGALLNEAANSALSARRVVTVKGFAERNVDADLAVWPIVYSVSANSLSDVQKRIEGGAVQIRRFLEEQGFSAGEISQAIPRITDFQTQLPGLANPPAERYAAESTVSLRTRNVPAMRAAVQRSGELISQGVALSNRFESRPQFMFTSLDVLKPQMIAEATRDARRAAQQFAEDSRSEVGAIRTASQGYFSIADRDAFSPDSKTVRVVTTIEYFLVD